MPSPGFIFLILSAFSWSCAVAWLEDDWAGEDERGDSHLHLLQTRSPLRRPAPAPLRPVASLLAPSPAAALASYGSNLTVSMAYVPYNFGHTVAAHAAPFGVQWGDCGNRDPSSDCYGQTKSEVTGCSLMYTPAKYWPRSAAQAIFGGKTVFGILRDPYERLVAQFRGSGALLFPDLRAACNLNEGVLRMVRDIAAKTPFANDCMFMPQAEFFEGEFGAQVAVDNRRFPESLNNFFNLAGYDYLAVTHEEIEHVTGCDDMWAGDLNETTKRLIHKVYAKDFDLLCSTLGYCDATENVCLPHINGMCPEPLFVWNATAQRYLMNATVQ